jgi:hypothetical protein
MEVRSVVRHQDIWLMDEGEVVSITRLLPFTHRKIPGTQDNPRPVMRVERLGNRTY